MDPRPLHFVDLPEHPDIIHWPANVITAHAIISNAYHHASQLLRQDDMDPLRLQIHIERLRNRIVPIFDVLVPEIHDNEWAYTGANLLAYLILELESALEKADSVYVLPVVGS
jgi:hypothetical protein